MYQNAYSVFNPGTTGLYNKYAAAFITRFPSSNVMYYSNTESLIYEQRVDKLNSGFGANITYANQGDWKFDWKFALNYAYHFDFKDGGKLGAGISVGKIFRRFEYDDDIRGQGFPHFDTASSRILLNFGLVYNLKNLNLGVGVAEMYFKDYSSLESYSLFDNHLRTFNVFGSYDIPLGNKFTLTPAIYTIINDHNGYYIFDYRLNLKIKERLWGGISYTTHGNIYYNDRYRKNGLLNLMAGYDILGKYRIGYALCIEFINPGSWNGYHEIGLAWMLK